MRRPSPQGLLSLVRQTLSAGITDTSHSGTATGPVSSSHSGRVSTYSHSVAGTIINASSLQSHKSVKALTMALLACAVCLMPAYSVAQEWQRRLHTYFDDVRAGRTPTLPIDSGVHNLPVALLDSLQSYFQDSLESVRRRSFELCYNIASRSTVPAIRTKGVDLLLSACTTRDPETIAVVLDMLTRFDRNDFSQTAKAEVRQFVQDKIPQLPKWIKLAAFLNLRELIPRIRPYSQPGNPQPLRWAALISLARLDEDWATTEILMRVKKLPVSDDLVYRIFPDLLFSRQRLVLDYVIDILQQDDGSCLSASADDAQRIPCGYRIMEQLAPVIIGFPLQTGEGGDITTTDYPTALALARKWLHTNKDYQLVLNRF